jgi:hypothetical protein
MRQHDTMYNNWVFSEDRTQEELIQYAQSNFNSWLNQILNEVYRDGESYMVHIARDNMLDAVEALSRLGHRRKSDIMKIIEARKAKGMPT